MALPEPSLLFEMFEAVGRVLAGAEPYVIDSVQARNIATELEALADDDFPRYDKRMAHVLGGDLFEHFCMGVGYRRLRAEKERVTAEVEEKASPRITDEDIRRLLEPD